MTGRVPERALLDDVAVLKSFLESVASGAVARDQTGQLRGLHRDGRPLSALELRGILDSLDRLCGHYVRVCRAVEQTADAVIITDRQGQIEYVNPAFELMTGYSAAEVLGRNPRLLQSGMQDAQFYAAMWKVLLAGGAFRGAIVNRKKSGDLYWAEQTITPVKDAGGGITHFVSVMKDVTEERKRREQEFYLQLARQVQQRFHRFADPVPGFDVAGSTQAAALTGGDYFDVLPHPDGRLTIAVGDVSGHGFPSALLMAETRAYVRAYSSLAPSPEVLLECLNRALADDLDGAQFVTLLVVRFDPGRRTLKYSSAGHVPGYLLDDTGAVTVGLQSTGPPLGLFPAPVFSASDEIAYHTGNTLVLLTDGVTEAAAQEGHEFGAQRALDVARARLGSSAQDVADAICAAALDFCRGAPGDDMTAVVCRPSGCGD